MSQALDAISDGGSQDHKGQQVAHNEIFTQLYDAPPKQGDGSAVNGVGRVLQTATGGVIDAGRAALANPAQYMDEAGMAAGIGFGLGAISKAGRYGPQAAALIGGGLMASWAYSEIKGDRWNGFGSAMMDSYKSDQNLAANQAIAAKSLGTFAVEFGVMGAVGGPSALLGRKVAPEGWAPKAFEHVKANTVGLTSAFKEGGLFKTAVAAEATSGMGRMSTHELVDGRSFASGGKQTKAVDVMADAANMIKETRVVTSLADIHTAVLEGKVKSDSVALGIKTEIQGILTENQGLGAKKQGLSQEIAGLEAQRTSILQSKPEQLAFDSAERGVKEVLANQTKLAELAAREKTLKEQTGGDKQGQGKGKGKGEGKEGEGGSKEELGKVRQEMRDLKDSSSEQALMRARARVHDAQEALTAKKATAETDAKGLDANIEAKKTELGLLEERGQQLISSVTDAMSRYTQRLDAIRADNGLIKPATAAEQAAAKAVVKPQRTDGGGKQGGEGSQARQVVDRSTNRGGEKGGDKAKVEEVKIDPNSPQGRTLKAEQTFQQAKEFADKFVWERVQAKALHDKADITSGKKTFTDAEAKRVALDTAENQLAKAKLELNGEQPKYAQTLKRISNYAKAIEQAYITDKDFPITESVKRLETLMEPIDHIWSPPPGSKAGELARPGRHGKTAEARLPDIQKHLESKIEHVDGNQSRRIGSVKENPTIKSILEMFDNGQLPEGGSIILTKGGDRGVFMQSELLKGNGGRGPVGVDAVQRAKHAETTPVFIDIGRLENGIGTDGAGLFRLIGHEKNINGAIIFQPVMKDGHPVTLRGNGKGRPMIKKEVAMTIGDVPEVAKPGVVYGDLLNMLRPKGPKPGVSAPIGNLIDASIPITPETRNVMAQNLDKSVRDPALLEQMRNAANNGDVTKPGDKK